MQRYALLRYRDITTLQTVQLQTPALLSVILVTRPHEAMERSSAAVEPGSVISSANRSLAASRWTKCLLKQAHSVFVLAGTLLAATVRRSAARATIQPSALVLVRSSVWMRPVDCGCSKASHPGGSHQCSAQDVRRSRTAWCHPVRLARMRSAQSVRKASTVIGTMRHPHGVCPSLLHSRPRASRPRRLASSCSLSRARCPPTWPAAR